MNKMGDAFPTSSKFIARASARLAKVLLHSHVLLESRDAMKSRRLQIREALEEMIYRQRGKEFQWLGVQIAKLDWPELQATQELRDGGEDATAFIVGSDGKDRRLACSLTGSLKKIRDDAARMQERKVRQDVMVFITAAPVDNLNAANWRAEIQKEFRHDLHIIPQAEIVARLEQPQNAWLCREYLHLDFADEPELSELEIIARRIAAETLNSWKEEYRFDQIQPVELTLVQHLERSPKPGVAEPQPIVVPLSQVAALTKGRQPVILIGPHGAGKTITLIQLTDLLLQDEKASIPVLLSLPAWASSMQEFVTWIKDQLAARGLKPEGFLKLNVAGRLALLLNGWNEVPDHFASQAANQLRAFVLNNPGTPLAIATRATRLEIPLSQKVIVGIEPLSAAQKRSIIHAARMDDSSKLQHALKTNPTLAEITDTPFFLGAVIELARGGAQLPITRFKILEAVILQMEGRPEHSSALNGPACMGLHRRYLCEIGGQMTQAGTVAFPHDDLLAMIAVCGKLLQSEGHLSSFSASTTVLDCLVKHHLLVLSPSFGGAYRFLHHQFQEWFAAEWLRQRVLQLVRKEDSDSVFEFQRDVLNQVRWQEPITFLVERLAEGGAAERNAAAKLIQWAMPVDLLVAAKLAGVAGEKVWPIVCDELNAALRGWYGRKSEHHCRCALAGMLATGMPDFQDILWPLIETDDLGIRLWPHRLLPPFPLESLGPDWRSRFDKWDEKRRAEFIQNMSWYPSQAHINLAAEMAKTDTSIEVKFACLRLLEDAGAYEITAGILKDKANATWAKMVYGRVLPRLPAPYLKDFGPELTTLKKELTNLELNGRFQILGAFRAARDPDWITLAKVEMDRLFTAPGITLEPHNQFANPFQPNKVGVDGTPYLISCFRAVHEVERDSALDWLATHLLEGKLWWEPFTDHLAEMPVKSMQLLVEAGLNPSLDVNVTRAHAVQLAKSGSAVAANALVKAYVTFHASTGNQPSDAAYTRGNAIAAGIEELPLQVLVDTIGQTAGNIAGFDDLYTLLELLMPGSPLDSELRLQLPESQRESVRSLVFRLDELCPASFEYRPGLRARLAVLLGAVGRAEDAKVLEQWLNEERQRRENVQTHWREQMQAWEAGGRRTQIPRSRDSMVHWNWYQGGLIRLGGQEVVEVFLRLLRAPELFGDAAWGLAYLSRSETPKSDFALGGRADYREIYQRKSAWEDSGKETLGVVKGRADAIFAAIQDFFPNTRQEGSNIPLREVVSATTALAELSDKRSIPLLLELCCIQHTDYWAIIHSLHSLMMRGVVLPGKAVGDALERFLAECEKEPRGSGQDNWYIVVRCLAVLLFSDTPSIGVERIRRLPPIRLHSYYVREILDVLGACRDPKAADLLIELSAVPEITGHYFHELVAALFNNANEKTHRGLLDLLDRLVRGELPQTRDANALAKALARIAHTDGKIRADIESRCKQAKTPGERNLLAQILHEIGDDAAALRMCDLIDDKSYVTHDMEELVKNIALNRIPAGGPGVYQLEPRKALDLRKRLLGIAYNDATRRTSALELLAAILDWRIEYGAPADEPFHPDIESLKQKSAPWPLIK